MKPGLAQFLRARKDQIVKTIEVPRQDEMPGYNGETGEAFTLWHIDEVEVVDFEALVTAIDAFEQELAAHSATPTGYVPPPPDPFRL